MVEKQRSMWAPVLPVLMTEFATAAKIEKRLERLEMLLHIITPLVSSSGKMESHVLDGLADPQGFSATARMGILQLAQQNLEDEHRYSLIALAGLLSRHFGATWLVDEGVDVVEAFRQISLLTHLVSAEVRVMLDMVNVEHLDSDDRATVALPLCFDLVEALIGAHILLLCGDDDQGDEMSLGGDLWRLVLSTRTALEELMAGVFAMFSEMVDVYDLRRCTQHPSSPETIFDNPVVLGALHCTCYYIRQDSSIPVSRTRPVIRVLAVLLNPEFGWKDVAPITPLVFIELLQGYLQNVGPRQLFNSLGGCALVRQRIALVECGDSAGDTDGAVGLDPDARAALCTSIRTALEI